MDSDGCEELGFDPAKAIHLSKAQWMALEWRNLNHIEDVGKKVCLFLEVGWRAEKNWQDDPLKQRRTVEQLEYILDYTSTWYVSTMRTLTLEGAATTGQTLGES